MKYVLTITSFLVLSFGYLSQVAGQETSYPPNRKLIPIATIPHNQPIKVFYENEKPDSAYVKIALLDAHRSTSDSYVNIINDLKTQAQEEGLDAIMIYKFQMGMASYRDSEGYMTSYGVKEILAYGIKYLSSFDYLQNIPRTESIFLYNDTTMAFENNFFRTFDTEGNLLNYNCTKSFNDFLYRYSLQHLVAERKDWTYIASGNLIVKRLYKSKEKSCIFTYDNLQRLKTISIKRMVYDSEGMPLILNEEIALSYNEIGQLHQRDIFLNIKNRKTYYREIYRYDSLGRLEEKQLFKYENEKQEPIAKFFYTDFYTFEDLKIMYPELN